MAFSAAMEREKHRQRQRARAADALAAREMGNVAAHASRHPAFLREDLRRGVESAPALDLTRRITTALNLGRAGRVLCSLVGSPRRPPRPVVAAALALSVGVALALPFRKNAPTRANRISTPPQVFLRHARYQARALIACTRFPTTPAV